MTEECFSIGGKGLYAIADALVKPYAIADALVKPYAIADTLRETICYS